MNEEKNKIDSGSMAKPEEEQATAQQRQPKADKKQQKEADKSNEQLEAGQAKVDTSEAEQKPEHPSLKEAMQSQAREDESSQSTSFTLRKILGGDWLTAEFLRRQVLLILLIAGFCLLYINNRYRCQKDLIEIDRLNNELTDAKYKALSSSSELTEICRESNVLKMLQNNNDSILKTASQPPYIINVPEKHKAVE